MQGLTLPPSGVSRPGSMERSHRKCIAASVGGHLFLFLILVFGSAFLNRSSEPDNLPKLKFIPSILVDEMVAGGGGNPKLPQSDETPTGGAANPVPTAPPRSTTTSARSPSSTTTSAPRCCTCSPRSAATR